MEHLLLILSKPDNVPIAGMLVVVLFFLGWGLRQGLRNDRLIQQGKRDEIIKDMQR